MAGLWKRTRRSLVWNLAAALITIVNLLPRRLAQGAGSWLGLAAWWGLKKDRYKIARHLTLALGDQFSDSDRHRIGRQFFVNAGQNLIDLIRFKRHFHKEIESRVSVDGLEYFEQALARGRGVIAVTGHIGNFELLAAYMATRGYPCAAIGRELYDRRFDQWLVTNREAMGVTNFATTDPPRKLIKWLRAGKVIGVLIDTDSFRVRSVFVPVFGRLSATPVGPGLVGLHCDSAFVPMACLRLPGDRYRIVIKPPIQFERSENHKADAEKVIMLSTNALEGIIRDWPEQWIWLHNRWHSRPVPGPLTDR